MMLAERRIDAAALAGHLDIARIESALARLEAERLAFSEADLRGRASVMALMTEVGLQTHVDSAFNVIGRRAGCDPPRRSLVVGSHLDTVPEPGRLDGALGVLAGVECARVLVEAGVHLHHTLEVVGFSDEEGTSTSGCWGARAMLGDITSDELVRLTDADSALNATLRSASRRWRDLTGQTIDPTHVADAARGVHSAAAYLELHIEQGPVLERAGWSTATVDAIVGIRRYRLRVPGRPGHAGTVPMAQRDDALVRACGILQSFWTHVLVLGDAAVVNYGDVSVSPGSYNVIPSRIEVLVETRSPQSSVLDDMEGELARLSRAADGHLLRVSDDPPVRLDEGVRTAVQQAACALDIPCPVVSSWAGHDAAVFAAHVPSGMLFVPSIGGLSHCSAEETSSQDMLAGTKVMLAAILTLDKMLACDHPPSAGPYETSCRESLR